MTKNEFLSELRIALAGEVPEGEIENNIRYYDSYIKEQAALNTEEQVLEQLGDSRLIAKTIIETYQLSHGPLYHSKMNQSAYQDGDTMDWTEDKEDSVYGQENSSYQSYGIHQIKWYHKVLLGVIAALVLVAVIFIGGFMIKLFFTIGIPLLIVYFIYKLIENNRKR